MVTGAGVLARLGSGSFRFEAEKEPRANQETARVVKRRHGANGMPAEHGEHQCNGASRMGS